MSLSEQEKHIMKILGDPALWAEATLMNPEQGKSSEHIKLRPYQVEMLRDKTRRKVSRMGRRTGKTTTMVIFILWYAFTHKDSQQVIATPYDSQIRMIFDMMEAFINNSPGLADSIANKTKNPHEIKLKNGSIIKGFTAGTRSGAEGGSLRGQAADWLYMDEIDYMTDGDFEAIYAIALADPKRIGVWISSTPTGRRGIFYKACTGVMPGWKEFYYPSMSNPNWDETMEKELRATFSDMGYVHEVLAEFGEETVGVFKKEYIDRATMDYQYVSESITPYERVIGVDWDKYGAATQMIVMEYDHDFQKFRVINREEVPKSKFTLDNGVKKIIELNQKYSPQAIYVDRGYGEYQVETLHKYGMSHPETGLHTKVVGVSFAASKAVLDPWTRHSENKPIKPFMVDQLSLLFENDRIIVNKNDEMITRQLENYRMVKKTANGVPIFTSDDEHTIDCMMLATLAFVEKFPQITFVSKRIVKPLKIEISGSTVGVCQRVFGIEFDCTPKIINSLLSFSGI
jgi:replicative DNA helicase